MSKSLSKIWYLHSIGQEAVQIIDKVLFENSDEERILEEFRAAIAVLREAEEELPYSSEEGELDDYGEIPF